MNRVVIGCGFVSDLLFQTIFCFFSEETNKKLNLRFEYSKRVGDGCGMNFKLTFHENVESRLGCHLSVKYSNNNKTMFYNKIFNNFYYIMFCTLHKAEHFTRLQHKKMFPNFDESF